MRVLISGAGIAGPTLAYWLAHYGFEPTIVERAPELRSGGYVVDFWGLGFEITGRMGLIPELREKGYMVEEVRTVNSRGKRVAWFPASSFTRVTKGQFVSIARSDLSASIFSKIEDKVEALFGDSISRIEQDADTCHVTFESGLRRDFDLVIGADGLHSRVRELAFSDESQFEKYLGYKVAAFQAEGYRPRDELTYVMFTEVGQQIARFAMRNDRTMFLFTFADSLPHRPEEDTLAGRKALLHSRFGNSGWECPQILQALDSAGDLYFDRVGQIHLPSDRGAWSRGRVTLIGDAASCASLLAGEGSGLAIIAAYILAGELHRTQGDYVKAFANYQQLFAPFVRKKQKMALRYAGTFAPKSRMSLFLRNQIVNLLRIRWFADVAVSRDMRDDIAIPNY